jgi:hypothetical protein
MLRIVFAVLLLAACQSCHGTPPVVTNAIDAATVTDATREAHPDAGGEAGAPTPGLPLVLVGDIALPGRVSRFDYQEIDAANGRLVIAHMGDNEVVVVSLADGSTIGRISNITTARGIAVASSVNRIFATATTNQLVSIDATTLREVGRVATGSGPDGVAWDPIDQRVGVSDQRDGAISIIAERGNGTRIQLPLGVETGNVVFDSVRRRFWIAVVRSTGPDQLVGVDPASATVLERIDVPGCTGAHGLRVHPDGQSALIACEGNGRLVRVGLGSSHAQVIASVGSVPDVLAIDSELNWLYVASESGDLTVFDLSQPGLVEIGREQPGPAAHSVAVDSHTHRVFFPLARGASETPVLRIMRPSGI